MNFKIFLLSFFSFVSFYSCGVKGPPQTPAESSIPLLEDYYRGSLSIVRAQGDTNKAYLNWEVSFRSLKKWIGAKSIVKKTSQFCPKYQLKQEIEYKNSKILLKLIGHLQDLEMSLSGVEDLEVAKKLEKKYLSWNRNQEIKNFQKIYKKLCKRP